MFIRPTLKIYLYTLYSSYTISPPKKISCFHFYQSNFLNTLPASTENFNNIYSAPTLYGRNEQGIDIPTLERVSLVWLCSVSLLETWVENLRSCNFFRCTIDANLPKSCVNLVLYIVVILNSFVQFYFLTKVWNSPNVSFTQTFTRRKKKCQINPC